MTRLLADPLPIPVEEDADGNPLRFTWEGKTHPISIIVEQWRADTDWWHTRVWRTYFKVITQTGLLVEIYHDQLATGWHLQRIYD